MFRRLSDGSLKLAFAALKTTGWLDSRAKFMEGPKGAREDALQRDRWFSERLKTVTGKQFIEGQAGGGFQLSPQMAQLLLFSLMAARQGGMAGVSALGDMTTALAAMKGIGAAAGPSGWIGFGISALATIFGDKADQKERNDQRRHQELLGALREGPARISQFFEGDHEASLYQNRRLERLGGVPRNGGL